MQNITKSTTTKPNVICCLSNDATCVHGVFIVLTTSEISQPVFYGDLWSFVTSQNRKNAQMTADFFHFRFAKLQTSKRRKTGRVVKYQKERRESPLEDISLSRGH